MSDERVPDPRRTIEPGGRPRPKVLLDIPAPHPIRSMFVAGWPVIFAVLLIAYLFAILFPSLFALLLVAAPLAVGAALLLGANTARGIRLSVTDQQVRVANSKAAIACDRAHVTSAVLVESLSRRVLAPRTTDLILLDRTGRCALLLSGRLWPPAVLEQVLELITPATVERVSGKQTPNSLAARFPRILENMDGTPSGDRRRQSALLIGIGAVVFACVLVIYLLLFR